MLPNGHCNETAPQKNSRSRHINPTKPPFQRTRALLDAEVLQNTSAGRAHEAPLCQMAAHAWLCQTLSNETIHPAACKAPTANEHAEHLLVEYGDASLNCAAMYVVRSASAFNPSAHHLKAWQIRQGQSCELPGHPMKCFRSRSRGLHAYVAHV